MTRNSSASNRCHDISNVVLGESTVKIVELEASAADAPDTQAQATPPGQATPNPEASDASAEPQANANAKVEPQASDADANPHAAASEAAEVIHAAASDEQLNDAEEVASDDDGDSKGGDKEADDYKGIDPASGELLEPMAT